MIIKNVNYKKIYISNFYNTHKKLKFKIFDNISLYNIKDKNE